MNKPTMFLSHSSRDADILAQLKELLEKKTGWTLDIFLSSYGGSILLGRNWVHRVEEALMNAKIMQVFLSPNSINSHWLYFEFGFAYIGECVASISPGGVSHREVPPAGQSLVSPSVLAGEDGCLVLEAYARGEEARACRICQGGHLPLR
jgi:TIR domain